MLAPPTITIAVDDFIQLAATDPLGISVGRLPESSFTSRYSYAPNFELEGAFVVTVSVLKEIAITAMIIF
ncbi:MAG: hypothetical protein CL553_11890 [Alcanivorax sp.]|nr:hypothetical protein [Alcanivorax sp.]